MSLQTITVFARGFGLSRTTLLYYDRIGLLKPASVNASGYRLYGDAERTRMQRINTFRQAGLSLDTIRELLETEHGGQVEAALEQRLAALNTELVHLQAQQRLIVNMLGRTEQTPVNVEQWVKMLEEAGIDEEGRLRWHQAFERDAPQAHQAFLASLGLDAAQVKAIRKRSQ